MSQRSSWRRRLPDCSQPGQVARRSPLFGRTLPGDARACRHSREVHQASLRAEGSGRWQRGRLVSVAAGRAVTGEGLPSTGRSRALATSTGQGTIKHAAVRPGVGTAYVIDRAGADIVVAMTREGRDVLPQTAEASNPSWSASGRLAWSTGSAILVRDPVSGRIDELPAPVQGAHVFAPVFLSDRRIAAVVSPPTDDRVPEGEQLNDLWATDVAGTRWRRLTHFRAGGGRMGRRPNPDRPRGRYRFRADQRARLVDRGTQVRALALRARRGIARAAARRRALPRRSASRAARLEPSRSAEQQIPPPDRARLRHAHHRMRRRAGRSDRRARSRPAERGLVRPASRGTAGPRHALRCRCGRGLSDRR